MGFIIIDETKLEDRISLWHNENYKSMALSDVYNAKVDCSYMLQALKQEEAVIDKEIQKLQLRKGDISKLMAYAKSI